MLPASLCAKIMVFRRITRIIEVVLNERAVGGAPSQVRPGSCRPVPRSAPAHRSGCRLPGRPYRPRAAGRLPGRPSVSFLFPFPWFFHRLSVLRYTAEPPVVMPCLSRMPFTSWRISRMAVEFTLGSALSTYSASLVSFTLSKHSDSA